MLFHLFAHLRTEFSPLNVFRYPSFRVIVALLTALAITWLLYPWFIRQLQARQIGQVIREELDANHQSKRNTPTMGGILLIFAVLISTLLWSDLTNSLVWIVVLVTFLYSAVGFVDDAMKLGVRGSKGLSERGKLIGQFAIAGGALAWLVFGTNALDTTLYFPFVAVDRFTLQLPVAAYVGFACLVLVFTSNAVNLTDGLDGLAIGPVITASGTFLVLAYLSAATLTALQFVGDELVVSRFDFAEYLRIPSVPGAQELAIFCASIVGAGIGFLWFNTFPAQVFMGDVGSLGLGGALGIVAIITKNELLSGLILGIFVVEAISVLVQRYVFKATGKRVFLMAPIHHHFERKKWSESQIVVRFWIISILLCLVALGSLKLR
ncbi:MAG: phospho-N-acetylmuramoyl-pentapeptide-transferase [Myxococcales bacterium]|nr:phospho-N-acetylmuramoyl-pentapeptide-transferase [Myxococcales bacterium]MCB9530597.1 phospho-N-acetylmuramoyl-pentapeptide-transferase [Myxococcales bacterium]